jgi:hypothetical protein
VRAHVQLTQASTYMNTAYTSIHVYEHNPCVRIKCFIPSLCLWYVCARFFCDKGAMYVPTWRHAHNTQSHKYACLLWQGHHFCVCPHGGMHITHSLTSTHVCCDKGAIHVPTWRHAHNTHTVSITSYACDLCVCWSYGTIFWQSSCVVCACMLASKIY